MPIKLANLFWFFLLVSISFSPFSAYGYHYENSESGADYILVGVGVFRQNITNVDGDEVSFDDSDEGLPSDYSNRSYLSLFGEGNLDHDWTFDLKSRYDQEDPDQEFQFLLNLYKDDNYITIGDHEQGSFLETTFTASDDEIRGITLHGETERFTGTVVAGAVRGESTTDEIRGDGTSGRYSLAEAPVIRASEDVRIEVRDRSNPSRIIRSTPQSAGRDYSIDYDRGELLFTYPIDESDFRGNPIFIVVSYQYDSPGGLYKRARYGMRTTFSPNQTATIGATYLADGPWNGDISSEIVDDRQQIYGSDLFVNINDRHTVYMEVAKSEIPSLETSEDDLGMRVDVLTQPLQDLTLFGNYWRTGKDFLTFGSRDLASGNVLSKTDNDSPFYFKSRSFDFDLDPNISAALGTNTESYGLSGSYDIGFHTISTGMRRSRDNIPDESDSPTNHRDSLFASVIKIHPIEIDYLLGTEVILEDGEGQDALGDSRTSRVIGGLAQTYSGASWSGPLTLQGVYQYEQFDDQENEDGSTKIHDIFARAEIEPLVDLFIYAEQGFNFLYEEKDDDFTERMNLSLIGIDGKINRYVELISSIRYKTTHDLLDDEKTNTEQTYELRWLSEPLDTLRTGIRFEYREDEDHISDRVSKKTLLGGELFWDVTSTLLFTFGYDREFNEVESNTDTDENTSYDDILFRFDWKPQRDLSFFAYYRVEYDELETEPLDATRVRTTTELIGGKYQLNESFEFVSAYRRKALDDVANNEKIKIYGELAYKLNEYLSIAPGYEYSRYNQEDGEGEYKANILYVSLIGKL